MGKGIPALEQAYEILFVAALVILAVFLMLSLVRAIIGPRVADRIVAINMMGTQTLAIIAILAVMKQEGYLADICLIYAMTSFLAVIVLSKVYMGVYRQRKEGKEEEETEDGGY
ncbi:MAG: monovalent cation/H+ antiporter complex subunit F [Lachnospiraceae bacterium]|nr:monovalent cation/H+ antiporter complex subunit F [Lachnospiraceae bacterium]MDD7177765.1 monovalent cation/H+ antiporter complex subunit F [bacterium]MDY5516576.1 monovalent cation/H+ antiporter complex subunit F [Lachnospiraceae bacterium]